LIEQGPGPLQGDRAGRLQEVGDRLRQADHAEGGVHRVDEALVKHRELADGPAVFPGDGVAAARPALDRGSVRKAAKKIKPCRAET
jgi:hypothetical protein